MDSYSVKIRLQYLVRIFRFGQLLGTLCKYTLQPYQQIPWLKSYEACVRVSAVHSCHLIHLAFQPLLRGGPWNARTVRMSRVVASPGGSAPRHPLPIPTPDPNSHSHSPSSGLRIDTLHMEMGAKYIQPLTSTLPRTIRCGLHARSLSVSSISAEVEV